MNSAPRVNWACCLALALALAAALPLASSRAAGPAEKASDAAVKTSDKTAADKPAVDLFDAMKSGDVDVKYVAKNSREGQLLVKNNTDQPLTVKLPDAFAAVPVLAQAVAPAGGNRGSRAGYGGNKNNNQNQGTGGGGLGGIGGGIGGGGGGAFNVAPEKVAKLKIDMVCLEHGKKEPNAHVPYEIRPIEEFTTDANVQELCKMVSAGKIDQRAAQAAAWHLANHMTWEQLMDKKIHHLLGGDEIYFTEAEIRAAMQLTDRAMKAAESRQQSSVTSTTTTPDTTAASSGRP
jgi:hypothetical protein